MNKNFHCPPSNAKFSSSVHTKAGLAINRGGG